MSNDVDGLWKPQSSFAISSINNDRIVRRHTGIPFPHPQLAMKVSFLAILGLVALSAAKDPTDKEKIPDLVLPCDCPPANCPPFLNAKSVSFGCDFVGRTGSPSMVMRHNCLQSADHTVQLCECQHANEEACHIKSNRGCPKPNSGVGDPSTADSLAPFVELSQSC